MPAGLSVEGRFMCHACGPHRAWLTDDSLSLYRESMKVRRDRSVLGRKELGKQVGRVDTVSYALFCVCVCVRVMVERFVVSCAVTHIQSLARFLG